MSTRRQAGFALLIVLWSLVLLSLILAQVLSAGRGEAQLAANLRNEAVAEAVADGAVEEAVFHLLASGPAAWATRGTHRLRIGQGVAEVAIEDVAGKVNPNTASPQLLRAMLGLCGAAPARATHLARAIMVWRGGPDADAEDPAVAYRAAGLAYAPPGLPLETLDELRLVLDLTPPLFACLAPHLSLYQEADPAASAGDLLVARALALAARDGYTPRATRGISNVVGITAVATVEGGRFARRATVRLTETGGRPFRILLWEEPAP